MVGGISHICTVPVFPLRGNTSGGRRFSSGGAAAGSARRRRNFFEHEAVKKLDVNRIA